MTSPLFSTDTMVRAATFSPCRRYRYELDRIWEPGNPPAMFVGLNPSTADETADDPTIRRCIRFARDWGYGGLIMANIFAFRATDPRDMQAADDPVGPENDAYLALLAGQAGVVVAAWGVHGQNRAREVVESGALGSFKVLGLTAGGHPRHPLYMKASCVPLNPLDARMTDHAYDALLDALATEDPEHRTRGLHESPSKYIASRLRADQPSGADRSASFSSPAEQPGVPSSSVGASGELPGVPGWSPARQ